MAIEVALLFTIHDAWNELPIANLGAILMSYGKVKAEGVLQGTSRRLINIKNKVNRSRE
jgi:hypothetical protein